VNKVVEAEKSFDKLVERKGIKDGFLAVADPEGIIFKPNAVKITDFYGNIDKQSGTLTWQPNFARIAANGDIAFTAGPYVYQNGSSDTDKVFGDYVSIWRADDQGELKLLIDLGIQHPEPETQPVSDFKNPDSANMVKPSKDPFAGKRIILATDNAFNQSLSTSTLAAYKEFLSPEGRYYFPGFEAMVGQDKTMKFIDNEAINIEAQTTNGGRSTSNDLAYTYGKARIKKGTIVSDYNYVRIWEQEADHKWYILLEVFSAVESD
jgi:ketosteroid isomerase-like protein